MGDKAVVYYNRRQINLTQAVPGTLHWNLPMNSNEFKIYKGSKNAIEVVVRNNDRKAINIGSSLLIITVANPESNQVVMQKPLIVRDPLQGSAVFVLDRFDTADWMLGFYRWNIVLQQPDTIQSILYTDQNEGGYGYFELIEGPIIGPTDSLESTSFLAGPLTVNGQYYYSGVFPGNAQINQHDFGAITLAIYLTQWSGEIIVQGCIEDSTPVSDTVWFTVPVNQNTSISLENFTGIYPITFEASLRWVRIKYLADDLNQGSFDKILFRT